jgi:hypothetical protein
MSMTFTV